jgi:hypothetical protein
VRKQTCKNHHSLLKIFTVTVVAWCASSAFSADEPPVVKKILQKAGNECATFNGGEFHVAESAITWHDFTGDGQAEAVVDASRFSCSTAASLWGGSGGTYVWVIVDGKSYEYLAHKWRVIDIDGQKVLLLAVHHSECGEMIGPCYRALVWDNGFRSTQ